MGEGAIPFSALDRYATRMGITGSDAFERLRFFVRALDSEYMDVRKAEIDKAKTAPPEPNTPKPLSRE